MDWWENQMHNMYDFDDVEWWHGMRCVMMWTDAGIKCITCLILMMWHGDVAWWHGMGGGWHGTSATCAKFIVVFENWREN